MAQPPCNIGIKAMEIYFPSQFVEQSELEKFDGVSPGKYTIGLGQSKMSFCDDREDVYSVSLTVTANLLKKYNIDPHSIGRLEVGTETILDKAKAVKTVLMQLFEDNTDVEGVDNINACYGGTSALFNAVSWVESSAWDGRDAIVVAADIALYAKGTARPTGGAGAIAMLIGPDAPVIVEPGLRGTHMRHVYDFYKPDLASEYPIVDGHYSVECYLRALDHCYTAYNKSLSLQQVENGDSIKTTPVERFDYMAFHAPTCKLVAKSFARLYYNDFRANPSHQVFSEIHQEIRDLDYQASLTDKTVEKTFMLLSKHRFDESVRPSIEVPTNCGNMYNASVYSGVAGLLGLIDGKQLKNKRIGVFSYGSGLASSFYSLKVIGSVEHIAATLDLKTRLSARQASPPEVYDSMCELRERAHLKKDYMPEGDISTIASGVYYLESVDDMFRRKYKVKA
ncbi:hydroxymethylglutaryl-coenzyme A synthase C terminal-domain-containing protein [Ilyonectria sp. MPI-CAGE-AT-0026]|nr:hydroxymethylglutaryl-coenzyme A synthase C terminal-domain-containing protein [Ilyonectria sp. MPI-CAGE-AT-0026]